MRRATLLAVALASLALAAGAAPNNPAASRTSLTGLRSTAPRSLLALGSYAGVTSLFRLDPRTLRVRRGQRIALGAFRAAWGFSRDYSRLVIARNESGVPVLPGAVWAALRFLDLRRMRTLGQLGLPSLSWIAATAWLTPRRVVVLGVDSDTTSLLVIDPRQRRVLRSYAWLGWPEAYGRTGDRLVFLLAQANQIGPARLVVAAAQGAPHLLRLDQIMVGYQFPTDADGNPAPGRGQRRLPGLALDPAQDHAYVVAADAPVAQVELHSLALSYHGLSAPVSLFGRFQNWLEPAAQAKGQIDGPFRSALWLGKGLIAVSGTDMTATAAADDLVVPAGLKLIDTHDWTIRTLDPATMSVSYADGLLLSFGDSLANGGPRGLSAYAPDGSRRFHLFGSDPVYQLQSLGSLAYAETAQRSYVIDLSRGQVLRRMRGPLPTLVISDSASG
jgi:hypothetical protein